MILYNIIWRSFFLCLYLFFIDSAPIYSEPYKAAKQSSIIKEKKHLSSAEIVKKKLVEAENNLKFAKNDKQADALWDREERLRKWGLTGSVNLMLSQAEDDLENGNLRQAEDSLTTAVALQPDSSYLHRFHAEILFKTNDLIGAIENIGLALNEDPGDPISWFILSQIEKARNHPQQASRAFDHVEALLPASQERDQIKKIYSEFLYGRND